MEKKVENLHNTYPILETLYVLNYSDSHCLNSSELKKLLNSLSRGAKIKLFQSIRMNNFDSMHSVVLELPKGILLKEVIYIEKLYVLCYKGSKCIDSMILKRLKYYLSKEAKVKHLQLTRLDDFKSIHTIVLEVPKKVLQIEPFDEEDRLLS